MQDLVQFVGLTCFVIVILAGMTFISYFNGFKAGEKKRERWYEEAIPILTEITEITEINGDTLPYLKRELIAARTELLLVKNQIRDLESNRSSELVRGILIECRTALMIECAELEQDIAILTTHMKGAAEINPEYAREMIETDLMHTNLLPPEFSHHGEIGGIA